MENIKNFAIANMLDHGLCLRRDLCCYLEAVFSFRVFLIRCDHGSKLGECLFCIFVFRCVSKNLKVFALVALHQQQLLYSINGLWQVLHIIEDVLDSFELTVVKGEDLKLSTQNVPKIKIMTECTSIKIVATFLLWKLLFLVSFAIAWEMKRFVLSYEY